MSEIVVHPAVAQALQEHQINAEIIACDPDLADTAAFCEHYGFALHESANTIIVASRKVEPTKHVACLVLATTRLDVNKKVTTLMGIKKASFADRETTQEFTGMIIGGVTVVGIERLPVYIDEKVMRQKRIVIGGGNRSSKLVLPPRELLKLPHAMVVTDLAKTI